MSHHVNFAPGKVPEVVPGPIVPPAAEALDQLELLQDLLAMAFVSVGIDVVKSWNERQQKDAKNWAIAHRLVVAGHKMKVPELPGFLLQFHPVPPTNITPSMLTLMSRKQPQPGEQILLKRDGEKQPLLARYLERGNCYSVAGRITAIDAQPGDRWIGIGQLSDLSVIERAAIGVGRDG